MLRKFYTDIVLAYPKSVLLFILTVVVLLGSQSLKLQIDASAETLMLEDDKDLRLTRAVNARYHNPDFLVIAFTPSHPLLSEETLQTLGRLSDELTALERVESVTSILNVPLLESPPKPVKELLEKIPTLESPHTDRVLAKQEFLNSPIYSNNLVSPDFKTTALLVNLYEDERYFALLNRRNLLHQKEDNATIIPAERDELKQVTAAFKQYRDRQRDVEHQNIVQVRQIMDRYRSEGELFLGGVSMIADDMVSFVKYDLKTYGTTVLLLLIVVLWAVFRQLRYIVIPVLVATLSVIATTGLLGLFGWEVTVISSNFISLQLIITMSLIIHLIVRYRELAQQHPRADQHTLVLDATLSMAKPCFFAIITTIAGFTSLVWCDILPVINLGWMMSAGIAISLLITFLVFPAVMVLLDVLPPHTFFESRYSLTNKLAGVTERFGKSVFAVSFVIALFSLSGAAQLIVENSFIDYFKKTTEIYRGMEAVDRKLGGTTPLDVVVDLSGASAVRPAAGNGGGNGFGEEEFDAFEEEFQKTQNEAQYWFTPEKMATVEKVHEYLESIPEVGKVLSLGTMLEVGKSLNDGRSLDNFQLALLYNELPENFRKIILDPYVNIENDEVRFALRIVDSREDLRRNELLKQIRRDLNATVGLKTGGVQLSNMMVLYNNMLQSLFESQILTLGVVVLILFAMFLLLFKSLKIALIAMVANLIPVGTVFGFMGWAGIPLDMMTITIAAISVGIAVDDTIHYIHRFKIEVAKDGDYMAAMHRSHNSIGYAMYYTSVAIMIGFSILLLSNFIPTIYFGILTVLAMFMALAADLLLLPRLIMLFKPFRPPAV